MVRQCVGTAKSYCTSTKFVHVVEGAPVPKEARPQGVCPCCGRHLGSRGGVQAMVKALVSLEPQISQEVPSHDPPAQGRHSTLTLNLMSRSPDAHGKSCCATHFCCRAAQPFLSCAETLHVPEHALSIARSRLARRGKKCPGCCRPRRRWYCHHSSVLVPSNSELKGGKSLSKALALCPE